MPTYATRADLPRHGLPAALLATIAAADQDAALAKASRDADGYLGKRFTLPLTAWGEDLGARVCAIAAYDLLSVRGMNPDGSDKHIADRNAEAVAWLAGVAAGRIEPAGIVDSTPAVHEGGAVVCTRARRGWRR